MAFQNMNRNRFHSFLQKKGALPARGPGEQDHASMPGRLKPHREFLAYGGYAGEDNYSNGKENYDGENERRSSPDDDDDYPGYPDYKRDIDDGDDDVQHYYRGGTVHSDGEGSMDARGRKQEDFAENQAYQSEDEKTGDPYIYNSSGEPNTNGLLRSKHNMEYMAKGGRVPESMSHQDDLDQDDELADMHGAGAQGRPQRSQESFSRALMKRRRGMR